MMSEVYRGRKVIQGWEMKVFNGRLVDVWSLHIAGIVAYDAPDYCDAYYDEGAYLDGTEMTDDELDALKDAFPCWFYENLWEQLY